MGKYCTVVAQSLRVEEEPPSSSDISAIDPLGKLQMHDNKDFMFDELY
jgi:hypothetical protein